jgi:hypothetical protein
MPDSRCRFCGAEIRWCQTPDGITIALELLPGEGGTYGVAGNTAVVIPAARRPAFAGRLYQKHGERCPRAEERREFYRRGRRPAEPARAAVARLASDRVVTWKPKP